MHIFSQQSEEKVLGIDRIASVLEASSRAKKTTRRARSVNWSNMVFLKLYADDVAAMA